MSNEEKNMMVEAENKAEKSKKRAGMARIAVLRDGSEHVIVKTDGRYIYTKDMMIKHTSKRLAEIVTKRVE